MNLEKCDRATAQGNMDAYFQDPSKRPVITPIQTQGTLGTPAYDCNSTLPFSIDGWAGNKLREKSGKQKNDYVNVNTQPGDLALTATWAVGILGLFFRILQVQALQQ